MKNLKLAYKLASGFIVLLLMMASVAAITLAISKGVKVKARLAQQESAVFAGVARQMKFDAIQIQQWLSDISATRGLDGLNDGFQKADEARKSFLNGLTQFREMYKRENDSKRLQKLDEIERKLQAYHEKGKAMAQAYIDGGPAAGNKHMPTFDKAAEELAGELDPFVEEQVGELKTAMDSIVASTDNLSEWTLIATLVALTFGLLCSWLVTRSITRPLNVAVAAMRDIAEGEGDLITRLEVRSRDEIGELAHCFNSFLEKMRQTIRTIADNAQSVASSSEELSSVSQQMSSNSEETATQANVVSAASEQVSKNVQTVAAGAEEMSASIKEIAKNTSEAARVAKEAVEVAEKTNQTIAKLGDSSAEIGNVVKVITSIAEQTNLLALNATIEAARAGEAGKGFAVVANEVKELAKQTAQATEDISNKVGAIQQDTQGAVEAIQRIGGIIHQVNDIANTIASAVEEQSVTTNEMSRNVVEASKGSNEIVQNITGVAQAAQSTASGATETQAAAQELARLASELQSLVNQFKYDDGAQAARPAAMKAKTPKAPRSPMAERRPPSTQPYNGGARRIIDLHTEA